MSIKKYLERRKGLRSRRKMRIKLERERSIQLEQARIKLKGKPIDLH